MSPTLDEANLLERVGGDWKLIREIAGLFTGEYPQMLDDVALAIRGRDAEAFFRAGAQVRSGRQPLARLAPPEIALELERMGMAGRFEGAAERLEEPCARGGPSRGRAGGADPALTARPAPDASSRGSFTNSTSLWLSL